MDEYPVPDMIWFGMHTKRQARIRKPHHGEADAEFQTLGTHDRRRRRMIVLRVPDGPYAGALLPIPFLQNSDEQVEDTDAVLMPIIHELMTEARGKVQ